MKIRIIQTDNPLFDPAVLAVRDMLRSGALTAAGVGELDVPTIVGDIISDVQANGDQALVDLERKLDGAELTVETLRVPAERISAAHAAADKDFLELIRRVSANIRQYQQHILMTDPPTLNRGGRELGLRYTPIDRAGVYVPGGTAVYPSSVLMTIIPAQVAGVGQIVMASPPRSDGDINEMVLALAGELGITEVLRLGGAVAIAAMAVGTKTIRPVQKVFGPGSAFVAEAKRQLLGTVGIDSIAGASEVLIIADDSARPDYVAIDLIAQAEHDPGSAVLVTTSLALAEATVQAIDEQLATLQRGQAARAMLAQYSAIIVVPNIDAACDVANEFATEHLQIVTKDDDAVLGKIRNAGAIFLGPSTPVPLGDYYAGPSHVLPTRGTAKFFGPLSCNDFLKASSVIRYDSASLQADADDVIDFANREGLTAHARAVEIRKDIKKS